VARKTEAPRDREANLLSRAAANLQLIHDAWELKQDTLEEALLYNRRIWNIFLTSVTREDNPLPPQVRQNIANLGLFVMNETRELHMEPSQAKLLPLININRQLAAGLRGKEEA
jgi:flagellar protein FlaF